MMKSKPFKAYVKEIKSFGKDAGELFLLTDGFHEVSARLTQKAKDEIMEKYPFY
jgi:hypothetical protein